MNSVCRRLTVGILAAVLLFTGWFVLREQAGSPAGISSGREEVVFWHFWGGEDREVVDEVVARFNQSQDTYYVRAVAMPGNNLHAKLFLSVAGGDPPDLVNQDDPVIPDWAARGVIQPLDQIAGPDELADVRDWLLPSAQRLSTFDQRMYGLCNGLDIRALIYNQSLLDSYDLEPPQTLEQLDQIATTIAPVGTTPRNRYGYLPDTRRLLAWGVVFGGQFFDEQSQQVTVDHPGIVRALEWMASYREKYGSDQIAAFRKGDQLPGVPFPLLPVDEDSIAGRYAVVMDGQWRVRNIEEFQRERSNRGLSVPKFGVAPLPHPMGGRQRAGWVNGNFFVVPRGAKNSRGAWEFAKFWIGYQNPSEAAKTCASGGWIPVSNEVIQTETFQEYLTSSPLFEAYVSLAASENQFPTPQVVGAAMLKRTIEEAGYEALHGSPRSPRQILQQSNIRIQEQLDRVGNLAGSSKSKGSRP